MSLDLLLPFFAEFKVYGTSTYGFTQYTDGGYEMHYQLTQIVAILKEHKPLIDDMSAKDRPSLATPIFKTIEYDSGAIRITDTGDGGLYQYQEPQRLSMTFARFNHDINRWEYIKLQLVPTFYGIHPQTIEQYNDLVDIFDYYLNQMDSSVDKLTGGDTYKKFVI